jgi:hypothetical protein
VRKFFVIPLLVVVYVLLGGPTASAHNGITTYVYLSFYDSGIDGRIEVPAQEIGAVLGIEFGDDADEILAIAQANQDEILAYLDQHTALRSVDGEDWPIEFGDIGILDLGPRSYLTMPFDVTADLDPTPRELEVEFAAVIEANPQKDALLHIENDVRSGMIENESEPYVGFSTGLTTQTVVLSSVPTTEQIGAVRGAGTDAVRTGVVHILFVATMLAPAVLLVRGRGFDGPAPSGGAVLRRVATVVGLIVASGLLPLWLIGLGVFTPSGRVAVAVSALSLLVAAGWAATCWARPRLTSVEALVVVVLGALQGVGYGRAFVDDGLDRSRSVVSLVGFGLGLIVGVAIVAVLAGVPMFVLRRTPAAPFLLGAVVVVATVYAGAWILEGVFDADWQLRRIENPWRVWPRNLVLAGVVTLAAVGLRAVFDARGALRPVGDRTSGVDVPAPEREKVVSA